MTIILNNFLLIDISYSVIASLILFLYFFYHLFVKNIWHIHESTSIENKLCNSCCVKNNFVKFERSIKFGLAEQKTLL